MCLYYTRKNANSLPHRFKNPLYMQRSFTDQEATSIVHDGTCRDANSIRICYLIAYLRFYAT